MYSTRRKLPFQSSFFFFLFFLEWRHHVGLRQERWYHTRRGRSIYSMGILFRKLAKHSRIPSLVPDGARTIFAGKNKRRPRHMFFSVNKGKRRRIFLVIHVFPHENMVNPYSVILCRPSLCINIILPAIYDWLECLMTRNMSAVSALISPTRYHQLFFFPGSHSDFVKRYVGRFLSFLLMTTNNLRIVIFTCYYTI